jgi:hypothetical protein
MRPTSTRPGLGTWLIVFVSVLLAIVAAARAEEPNPNEPGTEAPTPQPQEEGRGDEYDDPQDTPSASEPLPEDTEGAPESQDGSDIGDALVTTAPAAPSDESATGTAQPDASPTSAPLCHRPPVRIVRVKGHRREARTMSLTDCQGRPRPEALDALSILARPTGTAIPNKGAAGPDDAHVAPGVLRLHPGLLTRLQALADRWPDRTIEIVSGHRPKARSTSRHRHGRALDLRIVGVSREELSEAARALPLTGVGYYPNSVFTHIDVRHRDAFWVDRSGPGEPPDYGPWPPADSKRTRERVLANAFEALDRLKVDP